MIERAASGKSSNRTPDWRLYYWSWVAALFVWAAWQRFALPLDPIADPDTWGYLAPALRKLVGAEFGHTDGRNFVYPAFIFSLLRAFGDFRAIVIAQHLLGLLAGALLLIAWRRARVFVPDSRLSRAVHDGLGMLATTIFLLAGEPIRFEMQLRPEGVCAFLVAINLYLVLQFIAFSFVEKRPPWAAVGLGIGVVFTSILLASAKPSLALIAPVALVPVGIFFFRRGLLWQKIALAGGAALSAALLLVPEHFLSRPDETSRTSLPTLLFVNHAGLIRDQMTDDLQRGAATAYPRDWLERIHGALSTEITKSAAGRPGHFWSLGFDPDYLMYEESSIVARLSREFGNDVPALCEFYRYYYWRIWRERPFVMIRKIGEQMGVFYSQMCPAYNREKSLYLASGYGYGATILKLQPYPELWTTYPPAVEFVHRTELLAQSAPIIRQPIPLRMMLSLLSGTYRPLLLGALALSAAVLFQPRYRRRLGWLAALVLFVYSYNVATCLEVAVINSLEGRRYLTVQVFFTLFAQLFAVWLLCEMAFEIRVARKLFPD
ncbi:MAG: hypothetical protein QOC70_1912 [Verrucomicrobiota bacterium]|jgi:hypothetical protein